MTQVPIGNLADKVGFKTLLTLGYVLCGLTGLLYHWAGTSTLIFLGRLLQGVEKVPIWALAPALLSLQYANTKGKAIGIYNASFHFGLSAGPLLGMLLIIVCGLVLAAVGLALFSPLQQPWINASLTLASVGLGTFCISSMAYLNECVSDSLKGTISGAYYLFWGLGANR